MDRQKNNGASRMKLRDAKMDPREGDTLFYGGWTVEVTGRDRGAVQYKKSKDGTAAVGGQSIDEWRKWTPAAKVKLRGESDCVVSACCSGRCSVCNQPMREVHITPEGIKCETCCDARKHGYPKPRRGAPEHDRGAAEATASA